MSGLTELLPTDAKPDRLAPLWSAPGTTWRLALLLVLARTALVSGLLRQPLAAIAFSISAGVVVLDLFDLKRSRRKLRRA